MTRQPVKTYVWSWVGLIALLALTLGSAFIPMGLFNGVVNLAIAALKALVVAVFFMHLRHASGLLRLAAVIGLFMLGLLVVLSSADYATRHIAPAPWSAPG